MIDNSNSSLKGNASLDSVAHSALGSHLLSLF
jgi:hypothetical protein